MMQGYLDDSKNPNLKLGKITDRGSTYEVRILTKKQGDLVDILSVDALGRWIRSEYQ